MNKTPDPYAWVDGMGETHVEREGLNQCTEGLDVWVMWCGEQCLAFPDGSLLPEGFDFYTEEYADKATCGLVGRTVKA